MGIIYGETEKMSNKRKKNKRFRNLALVFSVIASAFMYLGIVEHSNGAYTIPQMIGMGAILFYLLLFAYAQI